MKFCPECGSTIASTATAQTRRQVTLLFSDIVGSTELTQSLDAETLRPVMSRYFELARAAIERHGGTVEKFIGDAVMAVFGLPDLHEDDALRAVRAAVEIRDAAAAISAELERSSGIGLQVRIGVNTGEVVAGEASLHQQLVTGDTVNIAARLQQAAAPGDILLGAVTWDLVREGVDAEPLGALELNGIAEPVSAHRLTALRADWSEGLHLETPLVGRETDLAVIRGAFEAAVSGRSSRLVTLIGPAGIGKSRLTHEFVASVRDRATVLRGRCLPYGEGITYWPIAMALRAAAGIDDADDLTTASAKLAAFVGDAPHADRIVAQLGGAMGLVSSASAREEIGWAFRRLLEAKAADRPVVLVVDDIQWAEETLLDLLESLAVLSRGAPILVLCIARPELFDARPGWAAGVPDATTLQLDSLPGEAMAELIANLAGQGDLPAPVVEMLASTAEGNPLFLEELVAMLVDDGLIRRVDGRWQASLPSGEIKVPPTIQALLAARLDRLEAGDRAVAQRGAVVGRVFQRGAIFDLSPSDDRSRLDGRLMNLVRKEIIRPDSSSDEDDAFRFRHLLMRDAAYDGLPKRERAELHQRYAEWLREAVGQRLLEFEEIVGYHFEQACRYRRELGVDDDATVGIGDAAAGHLGAAAWRALDRSDLPGAAGLLRRTLDTMRTSDPHRIELWAELVDALIQTGRLADAAAQLNSMRELLEAHADDIRQQAWFDVVQVDLAMWGGTGNTGKSWSFDVSQTISEKAIIEFERVGDVAGLSRAWLALALGDWWLIRASATKEALLHALDYARRAGRRGREITILFWLTSVAAWGPDPVEDSLAELDRIVVAARGDRRVEAGALRGRAFLLTFAGRVNEAAIALDASTTTFAEIGMNLDAQSNISQVGYYIGLATGQAAEARRRLEESIAGLEAIGDVGYLSTGLALDAALLYDAALFDEADRTVERAASIASPDDIQTQSLCQLVRAGLAAKRGDIGLADRTTDDALALLADSDFDISVGHAYARAAEISLLSGNRGRGLSFLETARERFARKGALAFVDLVERRIASIEADQPTTVAGT